MLKNRKYRQKLIYKKFQHAEDIYFCICACLYICGNYTDSKVLIQNIDAENKEEVKMTTELYFIGFFI